MTLAKWKLTACAAFGIGGLGLGLVAGAHARPGGPLEPQATPTKATASDLGGEPPKVDPYLAQAVAGRVLKVAPVVRDNMVLSYMGDWAHGGVDNIGVANNNGGVRTLIDWPEVAAADSDRPDLRFLLALYARKVTAGGRAGPILAFEVLEDWGENTSWKTFPNYQGEPAASFPFEDGEGWKIFDVTPIVRARAKGGQAGHGILLRFLSEDRGDRRQGWSGYELVSREGAGKWQARRPVLLVVDPSKK